MNNTAAASTKRHTRRVRPAVRYIGFILLALLLLVLGSGVALTIVTNGFVHSGAIAHNVYIETVPVGGLTVADAATALERDWVSRLPRAVTLEYPGGSLDLERADLGAQLQVDRAAADAYRIGREGGLLPRIATQLRLRRTPQHVPVPCVVDDEALDAALTEVAAKVNKPPKNAEVTVGGDDEVEVTPHQVGLTVDLEKSRAALLESLKRTDTRTARLVVNERVPAVTSEDLAKLETVLGSFSTEFSSGQVSRTHNLTLATAALDKTVLKPGDVLSVNDIVGERSPGRGYRKAPIFVEGGDLRDDYGGGLCQVATTLFNAALRANMAIVERSQHNRTVKYVPLGLDAMVSYGSIDMRFRNSAQYPVLVLGDVSGETLSFRIIGAKEDDVETKIERSGVATIAPPDKEVKDPELEEGKRKLDKPGWSGGRATAWRMTKINGEWKRTWSDSSYYSPGPNIYHVGTKKKPKKPEELKGDEEADEMSDEPGDDAEPSKAGAEREPARPRAPKPPTRPAPRPRVPSVPTKGSGGAPPSG
jgi:vancomycin resistance protein YoaR